MTSKIFRQLKKHKFTSGMLALFIIGSGYFAYGKIFDNDGAVRYATAQVQKGTLVISVSGSGQVSALNQVDVKPKVNGEITAVYVKLGQEVGARAILAAIDASDAERAVRDAETSLETAKLELDKMLEPIDELTLLQSENSLTQAKESKKNAEEDLETAHEDGFNAVANAFLDLPGVVTGLENMLFSASIAGTNQWGIDFYGDTTSPSTYKTSTQTAYNLAKQKHDNAFTNYKATTRFAEKQAIENLISETTETTKTIAEAVKNANNLIQAYKARMLEQSRRPDASAETNLSLLNSYTSKVNSLVSNLISAEQKIESAKSAITSAERSIEERKLSLAKTKEGPDDLDVRAKKIVIQQKEDALTTARETLADHYVRAPFAGVIAKVIAKKGDSASAGTAVATLITKQKIAEISLNEIDVAKVKTGEKTTLTFDAVPDLTITGKVAEVDAVGTVSQGVVTYTVKISFDTEDERIKTAMSVSATIITEAKPNVLLVPNSAVKSRNERKYVEVPNGKRVESTATANIGGGVVLKSTPLERRVKTGSSNDEFTEITSGLEEGDVIITRTIGPSSAQTQTSQGQNSLFRVPGVGGGSGPSGGFRAR
ncbi:MAG: efflux RND transporter periplasmic adaptor subunit [bacterium]|nr:efflux RND transporter periplasmic adaptor subunit [bacterium]